MCQKLLSPALFFFFFFPPLILLEVLKETCCRCYAIFFLAMFMPYDLICRLNGMVECGGRHKHIYQRALLLVEQVKVSKGSPLVTSLLEGPSGR